MIAVTRHRQDPRVERRHRVDDGGRLLLSAEMSHVSNKQDRVRAAQIRPDLPDRPDVPMNVRQPHNL
jgi:hypothetical protein